jgi:hypothetical protein
MLHYATLCYTMLHYASADMHRYALCYTMLHYAMSPLSSEPPFLSPLSAYTRCCTMLHPLPPPLRPRAPYCTLNLSTLTTVRPLPRCISADMQCISAEYRFKSLLVGSLPYSSNAVGDSDRVNTNVWACGDRRAPRVGGRPPRQGVGPRGRAPRVTESRPRQPTQCRAE